MSTVEFLKQVPLFGSLSPGDMEALAASIHTRSYRRGDALFRKDSEGTTLFIIRTGRVKIVLPARTGEEVILAIFSERDFFGEMSLLDGIPRSADAVALEACELLILSRDGFLAFLMDNKSAIQSVLSSLSMRLRKTDDYLEDTCFLNIRARFAKRILELADVYGQMDENEAVIDLDLTQSDLASMIGATRESVNKELRLLREKGLITTTRGKIRISNLERLKRRAH